MGGKDWVVLNKETEISHSRHATKGEAEKVAREMTEHHQREYIVKLIPVRDVLGRPVHDTPEAPEPRRRTLTDDQINTIAHEVRTKPLAEVGRHVMPLIHHIAGMDDRACQNCRFWVAYNRTKGMAPRGECTNRSVGQSVQSLTEEGEPARVSIAVITAFDWACKGWEQSPQETCDAQRSLS